MGNGYSCCWLLALLLAACTQAAPDRTAYAEALAAYARSLFDEGLVSFAQASGNGPPFVAVLTPATGEVPEQQLHEILEIISFTARVFEESGGLQHGDIRMTLRPPVQQQIIIISRPGGMPEPIGMSSEASLGSPSQPSQVVSVVNLAGTEKTLGRAYTIDWAVMQAVCLGFATRDNPDADAMCNIVTANAAAGWAGIPRDDIQAFLEGGSTGPDHLGQRPFEFRLIDFVYDTFLRGQ